MMPARQANRNKKAEPQPIITAPVSSSATKKIVTSKRSKKSIFFVFFLQ